MRNATINGHRRPARPWAALSISFWLLGSSLSANERDNAVPMALDEMGAAAGSRLESKLLNILSAYPASHRVSEDNMSWESILDLDLLIPAGDHALFGSVETAVFLTDESMETVASLKELYFEYGGQIGLFDTAPEMDCVLRMGRQIFSWGSGVLHNPTDNVSPWHAVDPFESRRRGILAANLSVASGLNLLDLTLIGEFAPTQLPDIGDRFFIYSPRTAPNPVYPNGPAELSVNYVDTNDEFEPDGREANLQYAAKYCASAAGWDITMSYFKGFEHTAVFEGVPVGMNPATGEIDLSVNYIYPEQQVWGLDVAGYVGNLGLHVEAAWFDMETSGHDVGMGDQDYTSAIGGIEYPFHDVIGEHDFKVSLEYATEISDEEDDRIYINRVYKDSFLCRIAHTIDEHWSGELRAIYNLDTEGHYFRLSYDYQYSDPIKFTTGFDLFGGPHDCFFGAYDDNDRYFVKLEASF